LKPRKKENKTKQNGEPKKSTVRDGGLSNKEQDKHLERKRKKKFQVQEQWNFILSSSGVTPSESSLGVGS
jgi:hypothetical protein